LKSALLPCFYAKMSLFIFRKPIYEEVTNGLP
jgi:hypothetical protein